MGQNEPAATKDAPTLQEGEDFVSVIGRRPKPAATKDEKYK